MALVDCEDERALFQVWVWLDEEDEEGKGSCYSTQAEAKQDFERLREGKLFRYCAWYVWGEGDWELRDSWPDDFDDE